MSFGPRSGSVKLKVEHIWSTSPDVDKDCSGLAGAAGEPTCRDGGSKEREESEPGADIFHHFLSCIVIFSQYDFMYCTTSSLKIYFH